MSSHSRSSDQDPPVGGGITSEQTAGGIKLCYLVKKAPQLDEADFADHWTTTHAALAARMPGLSAYSINLPSNLQRGSRTIDGYAVLRFPSYEQAKAAWATPEGLATAQDAKAFLATADAFIATERVVVAQGRRAGGIKLCYLVKKAPQLDEADFVNHWTTTHAALAARMPGLSAYSINLPSNLQRGSRTIDGYAVLRFPSYEQAKAAWATPEGLATAQDAKAFLATADAFIATERVVVADNPSQ